MILDFYQLYLIKIPLLQSKKAYFFSIRRKKLKNFPLTPLYKFKSQYYNKRIKQQRGCWIERSKLRSCFSFYISGENYPLTYDKCNEAPQQRRAQLTVLSYLQSQREEKSVKHKKCISNEGLTFRKLKKILREKLGRFYNE